MSELVAARYVDLRRLRPPRVELLLDVTLHNDLDEARWVLLPDTLAPEPRAPGEHVWLIAARELGDERRAFLLRATGDAGWYAVLVPPRADVTVNALPFAWWGDVPASVELPGELVRDLTVDGEPVGERLGAEPESDAGATVEAGGIDDHAAARGSIRGSPREPLRVAWSTDERAHVLVELAG